MTKFLSGRQKNLKIGITSYSENTQVLEVIGRVGIGSTIFSASYDLDVRGTSRFSENVILGANLYPDTDGLYDVGRAPQIGLGANRWKDANFLGKGTFGTGVSANDIELGVSSPNLIYSTSGNLELNSQSGITNIDDIVTISGNLGIGTTNPQAKFHSYGTDNTLSTVLGAPTNTLIEVNDDTPWSIAFRRTDLGPTADVAAGWIDNNRNFLIANGLPDGGFRYSVGLHTEYVKLYAYDQERFSTLGVGATVIGTLFANQLSVSGITTVGFLTATNISVSGVTTSSAYYIGTSQVISSARQLQNIASLDATTTATIETAIQQAPNDFTSLNISGISTLQSTTLIGGGTSTGTSSQNLQVTGGAYVSGNLGIGTTTPTSKLHVVGDTYISGILTATDINSASDIRLKTNIKPFENTLEKIVQINGVSFNWIDSNAKSGGIIAQDVEKVFPELVNDGDHKTVNYNGLIGVLVESIKELKQEVEDLKSKLH